MGNAFHKKQIPLGRGTKTHGVGIGYIEPAPIQPPRELTAEEIAARDSKKGLMGDREHNVHILTMAASHWMDQWEDSMLIKKGVVIDLWTRDLELEAAVTRTGAIINTAVTKSCNGSDVDIDRLFETIDNRLAATSNENLRSVLNFVREKFSATFEKLNSPAQSGGEKLSLTGQKGGQ